VFDAHGQMVLDQQNLKKVYPLLEAKDLDGCYHKAGLFDA
jgi:hypothetical protein